MTDMASSVAFDRCRQYASCIATGLVVDDRVRIVEGRLCEDKVKLVDEQRCTVDFADEPTLVLARVSR